MGISFEEHLIKAYDKCIGKGSRVFVVDPSALRQGSGGNGTPDSPFVSFTQAYALMQSGRNDIMLLLGGPTAGASTDMSVRLSSAFTWAKHYCHLIGLSAETEVGQRARITGPSSGGTFSPLFTISAHGCRFKNFSLFDDYTVDPVALRLSGHRNYFENVNMQGMGAATGADDAAGRSLEVAGGLENTFRRCIIGLDTIPRSAANAEIGLSSGAKRNIWDQCKIVSYCDSATHLWVDASTSGCIDRYNEFRRCLFTNAKTGLASGLTMTQGFDVHASAGGYIELNGSKMFGATDWCKADNSNVVIDGTAATAGSDGIMLAVTR